MRKMDEVFDKFIFDNLGSGKDQFDSFYDYRDQELDLAIEILVLRSYKQDCDYPEYFAA